jgi:hypothetical protein
MSIGIVLLLLSLGVVWLFFLKGERVIIIFFLLLTAILMAVVVAD